MGQLDTAAFDAAFKENYPITKIESQLNEAKVLYANVKKSSKSIDLVGRRAVIPVQMNWAQGIGARGENQSLPAAQHSSITDTTVTLKYNYAHIQVSGPTMDFSKNSVGAFAKAWDFEIGSALTAYMRDINRQMITGTGIGSIVALTAAQTLAGATSGIQVGASTSNTGAVNLYPGMQVDIYTSPTAVGGTVVSLNNTIVTVNPNVTPNTITLQNPITVTTATPSVTYVLRAGSKGLEMMGLVGIVDNGTFVNNLQGIDRQAFPLWQSTIYGNGGTLRNITESLMQSPYTTVEKTGKPANLLIGPYNLRDNYAISLFTQKQYQAADSTPQLNGGFRGLKYNDATYIPDEQALANSIFFLRTDLLELAQTAMPRWDDTDGSVIKKVSGQDSFEAYLKWYSEFGTNRANAHSLLTDVQ